MTRDKAICDMADWWWFGCDDRAVEEREAMETMIAAFDALGVPLAELNTALAAAPTSCWKASLPLTVEV